MVYRVMNKRRRVSTSTEADVPITVTEIQEVPQSSQLEPAYTVLDLSNPIDLEMIKQAGYDVLDLSASMQSNNSYASSDTLSVDTDISDLAPEIAAAAAQSMASGSLIPIIKEELKYNIQKKRLKEGKGILQVDLTNRRDSSEMTPEEEDRKCKRRERNKVAAQKCRMKRRERADELEQETEELEGKNDDLKDEIDKLHAEREMLMNMLQSHDLCTRTCNTRLSGCSDDAENPTCSTSTACDEQNLDIQMELEIECPESPFNIRLIEADHCTESVFTD